MPRAITWIRGPHSLRLKVITIWRDDITKWICNFTRNPVTKTREQSFRNPTSSVEDSPRVGVERSCAGAYSSSSSMLRLVGTTRGKRHTGTEKERTKRSYYYHNFRLNALPNSAPVNSTSMFAHVRERNYSVAEFETIALHSDKMHFVISNGFWSREFDWIRTVHPVPLLSFYVSLCTRFFSIYTSFFYWYWFRIFF